MNADLAPIVLFAYNRPDHLLKCLESLAASTLAKESDLFVFSDGPKKNATEKEIDSVHKVREILKQKNWCKTVTIKESPVNQGLAKSVESGVTEIVNRYGKIIVLEDDLLVSKHFLSFMNEALKVYANSEQVFSVNGYMFPIKFSEKGCILLPYISTWGWGTWKEKWKIYNSHISQSEKDLIAKNPLMRKKFNLADYDYTSMLDFENNSWGIKWYHAIFKRNGLSMFPTQTLVKNIGNDGTGTNQMSTKDTDSFSDETLLHVSYETKVNAQLLNEYKLYFTQKPKSSFKQILGNLKNIFS